MLETASIRVADYRPAIDRVLAHYGLTPETLELVPSVFDWAQANGVAENNVGRMAFCLCNWAERKCRIVMCETFDRSSFDTANLVMTYRGFGEDVDRLNSDKACLLHLLLHEIACHVLQTTEQESRDRWAFREMAKHDI
jgi:hypothetical protein